MKKNKRSESKNSEITKKDPLAKQIEEIEKTLLKCDTHGGTVHVNWDDTAPVTPFGQFVFFACFLKTCGLFENLVETCPPRGITFSSRAGELQASRNILGAYVLSILCGHKRYAHITGIRHDTINPGLLGMTRVYSEDTIRRSFKAVDPEAAKKWLRNNLFNCYRPLLQEEYIMDIDTTVKCLYGHQEGAEIGYNPQKPGRPSHTIHTYMIAELKLILDSEIQAGTEGSASHTMPGLIELLNDLTPKERPSLIRGDCAFGNENVISQLENLNIPHLFKIKQTKGVKKLTAILSEDDSKWQDAGQGWQGIESELQLDGWTRKRKVVILRKEKKEATKKTEKRKLKKMAKKIKPQEQLLPGIDWDQWLEVQPGKPLYEYAALVTSLDKEALLAIIKKKNNQKVTAKSTTASKIASNPPSLNVEAMSKPTTRQDIAGHEPSSLEASFSYIYSIAQLYRDRASSENFFDELKNQWGWGGFVTQDLLRSQISARIVALVYNWWTLFTRWVDPDKHKEGITSRPLMLHGVARQVNHGGQTILKITHMHGKREKIQKSMKLIQNFLGKIKKHAEHIFSQVEKWILILSEIFRNHLGGRLLVYDS